MSRAILLKHAFKLVPQYGFSRQALIHASPDGAPLSDSAITALFGRGEEAPKTLFQAWLEEGLADMKSDTKPTPVNGTEALHTILSRRLKYNEPVLEHLPEAFAMMSSPSFISSLPITIALPRFRIIPGLQHVSSVADDACWILADAGLPSTSYYLDRARVGAIYAAAELHQLSAPNQSDRFLRDVIDVTATVPDTVRELGTFAEYVGKSWMGILRSRGM